MKLKHTLFINIHDTVSLHSVVFLIFTNTPPAAATLQGSLNILYLVQSLIFFNNLSNYQECLQ